MFRFAADTQMALERSLKQFREFKPDAQLPF